MFFLRGSELQTLSAELGLESRAQFGPLAPRPCVNFGKKMVSEDLADAKTCFVKQRPPTASCLGFPQYQL